MQTSAIDGVEFDIPDFLYTHVEDDRTLLAFIPSSDTRTSDSPFARHDARGACSRRGGTVDSQDATEEGCALQEEDSKMWLTYSKPAT